jgi:hypothetical protein
LLIVKAPPPVSVTAPAIWRSVKLPVEDSANVPVGSIVIVLLRVVELALTKVTVLPPEIVTPSRVAVPLFWITPPPEVVSVPPVIVAPLSSTTEPTPVPNINPPVLVKVPIKFSVPLAHTIASEILCLPFYGGLTNDEVLRKCDMISFVSCGGDPK